MNRRIFTVLGLMSGTSLDGVDAALLRTDGKNIFEFGPAQSRDFLPAERKVLHDAVSAALGWQFNGAPPNIFSRAEKSLHRAHINAAKTILNQHPDWKEELDLIAIHGQTVLHRAPSKMQTGQTLQLGDGQVLADRFDVPCYFDFRSQDVMAGGQGAPLAPIYHKALCHKSGLIGPIAVLNLGGVGNVTYIDAGGQVFASDTGPANGPLDSWVYRSAGQLYDKGGKMSLSGTPNFDWISRWMSLPFFSQELPRSADRYDFDLDKLLSMLPASEKRAMNSLEFCQTMSASLAAFTAQTTIQTLKKYSRNQNALIVCGGGRHNKALLWMLEAELDFPVMRAEDCGWDGDAVEAQAFAFLAVRSHLNLPISFPGTTGVNAPMCGGRAAMPNKR